ncbi:hypothetical protein [Prochlorothrix hollandica]|uniref:hypothetical protein n=1 Tax=Prochlorothrix hollandica TaxID=1223 RepID=UPI003340ADBD
MVIIVIVTLNLGLALLGFWGVGQLWILRRSLISLRQSLRQIHGDCYRVLHLSPQGVTTGQRGTRHLRHQYHHLQQQIEQVQQLLAILQLSQGLWRRRPKASRSRPYANPKSPRG